MTLGGERYASCVPPAGLAAPLAVTFEQAAEALAQRRGCSSSWTVPLVGAEKEETRDWQLDGNLQDRNERLLLVDVKGTCPSNQFESAAVHRLARDPADFSACPYSWTRKSFGGMPLRRPTSFLRANGNGSVAARCCPPAGRPAWQAYRAIA